ncbi:MAG: septum site-determining protein MinC [Pseudomonadota bacterium]|nr:septum site-determining protein MinC [Pseudomonadota bacterium]
MFLNQSFELKSNNMTFTSIRIKEANIAKFEEDFIKASEQAPKLFKNAAFIVIFVFKDFVTSVKLKRIKKVVESVGASLLGIKTESAEQISEIKKAGISIIYDNKAAVTGQKKEPTNLIQTKKLMVHGKVRSGTQLYAKDKDIVICGDVSHGSEIIASGNIFIYGSLYGKAIAGVDGDKSAQIFCTEFAPELISIAGTYIVNEDFTEEFIGKSVSAKMENDKIKLNTFMHKRTLSIS